MAGRFTTSHVLNSLILDMNLSACTTTADNQSYNHPLRMIDLVLCVFQAPVS